MIPRGLGSVMSGYGYTVFDTAIGRCGIAWGEHGIVGVQLPEARELDTRRRLYQLYPEAREQRPPLNSEIAIEGIISAVARRQRAILPTWRSTCQASPISTSASTSSCAAIPRGETRTYDEVAGGMRVQGAVYSVAQAIGRNPFMIIVPCHRVLEAGNYADKISPYGGVISKRRLLSIEGAHPDHEQDPVRGAVAGRCAAAPA